MATWKEQSAKAVYHWLGEPKISVVRLLVFFPAIFGAVKIWQWMCRTSANAPRLLLLWAVVVVAFASINQRPRYFVVISAARLIVFAITWAILVAITRML